MFMIVGMMLMSPRIGKLILYFVLLRSWCCFVVAGEGRGGQADGQAGRRGFIYSVQHSCIPVVHIWTLSPTFYVFCTVLYSPGCIPS